MYRVARAMVLRAVLKGARVFLEKRGFTNASRNVPVIRPYGAKIDK